MLLRYINALDFPLKAVATSVAFYFTSQSIPCVDKYIYNNEALILIFQHSTA